MKIICIVGRSSSGKDTIYHKVLEKFKGSLKPIVTWTTREKRMGEVDGVDYHFTDNDNFQRLLTKGKVVEYRVYDSFGKLLTYFTCKSDMDKNSVYIAVTSLAQVNKYADYFGVKNVYPIHIQVEDRVLLDRALDRCKVTGEKYKEVCRRYISDCDEWEKTSFADGLSVFKVQNDDLDECCNKVYTHIQEVLSDGESSRLFEGADSRLK